MSKQLKTYLTPRFYVPVEDELRNEFAEEFDGNPNPPIVAVYAGEKYLRQITAFYLVNWGYQHYKYFDLDGLVQVFLDKYDDETINLMWLSDKCPCLVIHCPDHKNTLPNKLHSKAFVHVISRRKDLQKPTIILLDNKCNLTDFDPETWCKENHIRVIRGDVTKGGGSNSRRVNTIL